MRKNGVLFLLEKYRMAVCSAVLFVFFALVVYYTNNIQLLVTSISVNAKFWPRVIGVSGCVLSLMLGIQSVFEARAADAGGTGGQARLDTHAVKTLGLIFLYILGLEYLGFFVMTLLYLFCQFYILAEKERRSVKRLAFIALLFTPAIYIIFRYVFQMMLPVGTVWGGMA